MSGQHQQTVQHLTSRCYHGSLLAASSLYRADNGTLLKPNDGHHFGWSTGQRRDFSRKDLAWYVSSDCPPIGYAQQLLESVHETTGLPWWGSILLTAYTLRTVITLPLTTYSSHIMARIEKLQPEVKELGGALKGEIVSASKPNNWDENIQQRLFRKNVS